MAAGHVTKATLLSKPLGYRLSDEWDSGNLAVAYLGVVPFWPEKKLVLAIGKKRKHLFLFVKALAL